MTPQINSSTQHAICLDLLHKWSEGTLEAFVDKCPLELIDLFIQMCEWTSSVGLSNWLTDYKEERLNVN